MRVHGRGIALLAIPLALGTARTAHATDGHFLHGVGAVNAAMGGAGVATSASILGAFYVNPAGLARFTGDHWEVGFEMFKPDRTVSSAAGPMRGSTRSKSDFTPIPALAWTRAVSDRVVVGVAGIGVGGFGVDYPADPQNPILAPRPYGFGQVYSSFQLLKIVPALGLSVSPRLRLGFAANVDWAALAVDPMPTAAPAFDPGPDGTPGTADDRAYYSRATATAGAFGVGAQAGLQYALTPQVAIGLAYTTPQRFQDFEYHAVYENPNLPNFGTPRTIRFQLDVPAIYAAGIAVTPLPTVLAALDAKYITYASTRGFSKSGFNPDGSVKGFGWRNIWTVAAGTEIHPSARVAARVGYNFSQNPIPDRLSMFNTPAPAIVQHHATLGLGYTTPDGFGFDVGFYHAFRNSITGPIVTPAGAMPGTSVTNSLSENSVLIGFRYAAPGEARRVP